MGKNIYDILKMLYLDKSIWKEIWNSKKRIGFYLCEKDYYKFF